MTKKKHLKKEESDIVTELKAFRERLGPAADSFSDSELRQIQEELEALINLLIDMYLNKKRPNGMPSISF